jgi:hypothetical protein
MRSGLRPALASECAQNAARLVRDLWGHILVTASVVAGAFFRS